MSTWSVKARCRPCRGTGLYVGLGERDGFAVVCSRCKGSGCEEIRVEYEPFVARERVPEGVTHVLATNPGICAAPSVTPAGVTLAEWLRNPRSPWGRGKEMRSHTCPAWWYQSADSNKKPDWKECGIGARFADCEHFPCKDKCWARWDQEQDD